jgi:hypothetical protein
MDPDLLPLRDIHLPEAVGWWPLAPGWWFLIALAAAGLGYVLYRQFVKWRWNAARRAALRELASIRQRYEQGSDALVLAKSLSELLRRGMLAYAPRGEIAGLTGDQWLHWLDRGLDDRPFTAGAGRDIETLPYRRPDSIGEETDIAGMIEAVRRRLKTPLPEVAH